SSSNVKLVRRNPGAEHPVGEEPVELSVALEVRGPSHVLFGMTDKILSGGVSPAIGQNEIAEHFEELFVRPGSAHAQLRARDGTRARRRAGFGLRAAHERAKHVEHPARLLINNGVVAVRYERVRQSLSQPDGAV